MTIHRPVRTTATAALVLAATATLAACGSDSSNPASTSSAGASNGTPASSTSAATSAPASGGASSAASSTVAGSGGSDAVKQFTTASLGAVMAKAASADGGHFTPLTSAQTADAQTAAKALQAFAGAHVTPATCEAFAKASATKEQPTLMAQAVSRPTVNGGLAALVAFKTVEAAKAAVADADELVAKCPSVTVDSISGKANLRMQVTPATATGVDKAEVQKNVATQGNQTQTQIVTRGRVGNVVIQTARAKDGDQAKAVKDLQALAAALGAGTK